MVILNQDRDQLIAFEKGDVLIADTVMYEGVFQGMNLLLHGVSLGTYDTMLEILTEMQNIVNCKYPYYVMGGFRDYKKCFN